MSRLHNWSDGESFDPADQNHRQQALRDDLMTTLVTFLTDRLAQDPTVAGSKGSTLRGKTASRGRATGTARVLRADAAPPRLHEGDILVTTNVGTALDAIPPLAGRHRLGQW